MLAHIKTQLACLERGAPVEILFQSLAGTETTNLREFDISVDLLDHGYRTMAAKGALRDVAEQFMYFETGQGSEFTYGKHHGIDMTTTEALCYGLARRYDPFMVNNVTGFIGPETHLDSFEMMLANLQDHFMGKLLGLPMGMAPCYTLHSRIILEGQQIATQLLTAGGRQLLHGRLPEHRPHAGLLRHQRATTSRRCAKFTAASPRRSSPSGPSVAASFERDGDGNLVRGPQWGNPKQFCESEAEFQELAAPHAGALRLRERRSAAGQCRHAADETQPGRGAGRHSRRTAPRRAAKDRPVSRARDRGRRQGGASQLSGGRRTSVAARAGRSSPRKGGRCRSWSPTA